MNEPNSDYDLGIVPRTPEKFPDLPRIGDAGWTWQAQTPKGLAAAEEHARTCLSLPIHPQMSDAEVAQVIDAVNGFKG